MEDLAKSSASSENDPEDPDQHKITFETKDWVYVHDLVIRRSDPSQLERLAKKYLRKGTAMFLDKRVLTPENCAERIAGIPNPTIYLAPGWEIATTQKQPRATTNTEGSVEIRQDSVRAEINPNAKRMKAAS
jgi:hypothetical protein